MWDRGRKVPIPCFKEMPMNVKDILEKMTPVVESLGCFVVDVEVSPDNDITFTIEKTEGAVEMDDCIAVNNAFLDSFDRDVEDYSLTVTSAGLDQPLKVYAQFRKALGTEVTVSLKGGRRHTGTLTAADEEGICLRYTANEAVEGKKKKVAVEHEENFPFTQINSVIPYIEFK